MQIKSRRRDTSFSIEILNGYVIEDLNIIIPINRDLFDQSSQDHLLRIQRCSIKLRCPMLDMANRQVKTLCDTMELHITVPEEKLRLWAEEAFSSGLGGRGIMKKLQTALDEQIFEDPCRDMYSGVDQ